MLIKYHHEELELLIDDLSQLLGLSMILLDTEHHVLVNRACGNDYCATLQADPNFREYCRCSDTALLAACANSKKAEIHLCHAGLCDIAMPIVKEGQIAAYVMLGRIRSPLSAPDPLYAPDNGAVCELYRRLPALSQQQIDALCDLLSHILFEHAIELQHDDLMERALRLIDQQLNDPPSITELCQQLNASKNRLYHAFHLHFGTTVNQYITDRRIEKAKLLLKEQQSLCRIAEQLGYDNYTYFCRLFKQMVGLSPSQYRQSLGKR